MHPDDIAKTANITPFGLYEFLRMPFGLKNAAQAFQRLMDTVLQDVNCAFVYLDDILSEPLKTFRDRTTSKVFRNSSEMINFYHRFIPHAAALLRPLYSALKKSKPHQIIDWTNDICESFTSSKAALANATMLSHPKPGASISLTSDASDQAVGAVLEQYVDGFWQPLAFFSKQLRPPEQKYSTFDRELLALYLAIRHFKYFLEGRSFTMFTDHKPLVGAMSKASDMWTARQQRHLAHISEFSTDIRHISGKDNVVADCLSRNTTGTNTLVNVVLGIDYAAMARAQTQDTDVQAFQTAITGLTIRPIQIHNSGPVLLCDVSLGHPRPIVPRTFQRQVFEAIHNLAHPGRKSTVKLVANKFVWHGVKKQGFTHLLTIIDRTTRWPEAIPMVQTSTTDCAIALIRHWIARFGVPLDMATVPKEDLDTSSAELVYGEPLTVPGEFVNPNSRLHSSNNLFHSLAERFAPIPTSHHGLSTPSIPPSLKNARFVFVRRDCHRGPLQRPYDGPYRVITGSIKERHI
ncbi:hypothetical protein RRG08_059644, partial [Elysia crispata]